MNPHIPKNLPILLKISLINLPETMNLMSAVASSCKACYTWNISPIFSLVIILATHTNDTGLHLITGTGT